MDTEAGPTGAEVEFGWDEIGRHNRFGDCWVVIDGGVYDVTRWVAAHPGGRIVGALAGEDVTALFHSSHLRDVTPQLRPFRVGRVRGAGATDPEPDPFLRVLRQRVLEALGARGVVYPGPRRALKLGAQLLVFFGCWAAAYLFGCWWLAVPMGLVACALVGAFAHEYCHSTLTRRDNRDGPYARACSLLWPILFPFMLERHFQYEHLKHHLEPMDPDHDYEVAGLARFLRLSPRVPYRWYFRYQHLYAPLVYAWYITIQVVESFRCSYFSRRAFLRDPGSGGVWRAQLVSAAAHVALPIAVGGWLNWLVSFVLFNCTWQFTTYLVAAVVHMTGPDEPAPGRANWSLRVCRTTCNVLTGSRIYGWLAGGFNYQVDHHLLPAIPRDLLPQVHPVVVATCAEFGYPYREYRSLVRYCLDHFRYLRGLGRPPRPSPGEPVRENAHAPPVERGLLSTGTVSGKS
jgi:linoleoyl-CoA desaturase